MQSVSKRPNQFILASAIYVICNPSISHIIFIFDDLKLYTISTNIHKVVFIFISFIIIEADLGSISMSNYVNSLFMSFDLMSNDFWKTC